MKSPASAASAVIPVFELDKHHHQVKIPTEFDLRECAKRYAVFPLKVTTLNGRKRLLLAMRNPSDHLAVLDCEFVAGMKVIPVQANATDIDWLTQKHFFGRDLSVVESELGEFTQDVFSQLTMTTDAQKQPSWVTDQLRPYTHQDTFQNIK